MNKLASLLLATLVTIGVGGCQNMGRPNWFSPGTAAQQQGQAQQFDPYPENELGPQIVGSRPREFQKPPPETTRARWLPWNWGR